MKTITSQEQFFALLRAGLWNQKADIALFENGTNWDAILEIAKSQSLLGIIFDGIATLPQSSLPDRKLYLQWCSAVEKIERNNRKLNGELKNVFELYKEQGLTPVLLKGQGVAQNYLNPSHRQCGDIDIYLGSKQYPIANKILQDNGASGSHEESNKHFGFRWHQIEVENHRIVAQLNSPGANGYFQRTVSKWFPHGRQVEIDGYQVVVPPADFDALFLLIHAIIHFLSGGIGLRQVCDWACLLHTQQAHLNLQAVAHSFQQTGLTRAGKAFGVIAVNYLGLPEEELPFKIDEKDRQRGLLLLNDILQAGNFGQYDERRKDKPESYWGGKWYTFTTILSRCRELGEFAPAEARWYPLILALNSAKMQIKNRIS